MQTPYIPILTYHSLNILGNSYELNDHVALATDLELISRKAIRICPLGEIVDALEKGELSKLARCVAITFDDGTDFDFHDMQHPKWGAQKSMLTILREASRRYDQPTLEATSFVIVSPDAREELDKTCMIGRGWWNDTWWNRAEESGMLRVENHSFDHNHDTLNATVASAPKGGFALSSWTDADREIAIPNEYLRATRGRQGPVLFAYPYGECSPFLAEEYFPRSDNNHGIRACFSTDGVPVSTGINRWNIPRFVCGRHWKSPAELEAILASCGK